MWTALTVNKGDILTFRKLKTGLRSYLAVSGGVAVQPVLSSRATYLRGGIGGFQGRALMTGDIIARYLGEEPVPLRRLRSDLRPRYEQWTVRVVLGPQDHLYIDEAKEVLASAEWTLLPDSDRMGFRFAGPTLEFKSSDFPEGYTPPFIVDDFIPAGGMQTPSEGLIIAMGVEGPSIGGYAKIATVISTDFSVLAQVRPGQVVKFLPVSWADAVSIALRTQEDFLSGELWEDVSDDGPNDA
jgi:antagonist of KipI